MAPNVESKKDLPNVELLYKNILTNKNCLENLSPTVSIEDLPDWYNEKLFKLGQEYGRRNLFSTVIGVILGLSNVFTTPEMINLLKFTKQSSSPCAAFKRYLQTIKHHLTLYNDDINDPNSKWWRSLNTIRCKHSTINQKTEKCGIGKFPQLHMALTQFGSIGYALLKPIELGFSNEPEYLEGFVHFWRVIGYLLGIPNEINLCRENSRETTALCEKILNDYFVSYIEKKSEGYDQILKPVFDGLWYIDITVDFDATMHFWHKLNGLKYVKPMNLYSLVMYMQKTLMFYLLHVPYVQYPIRYIFNYITKLTLWIAENLPIFAWMKFGKQRSKIHLYPIIFKKIVTKYQN